MQSYACYEYGKLVRFAAANTGKERTPTFPGRYSMVWKQRLRISSLDETWEMPFTFNIHNEAGSAFHQFAMPGRPVSHSCIRQFLDDAEWLYNWGDKAIRDSTGWIPHSGTTVIIIDYFDFNRKRYWRLDRFDFK
jgi:lipoprotein-anchoring transpeptidase ErfK/SrfK